MKAGGILLSNNNQPCDGEDEREYGSLGLACVFQWFYLELSAHAPPQKCRLTHRSLPRCVEPALNNYPSGGSIRRISMVFVSKIASNYVMLWFGISRGCIRMLYQLTPTEPRAKRPAAPQARPRASPWVGTHPIAVGTQSVSQTRTGDCITPQKHPKPRNVARNIDHESR